jgi:3-hydroxyisobutyrate dehydrogenase-like beta-hydroxyacid dehydrogenase
MGLGMAKRLLTSGNRLTVYNRTRGRLAPLEALGATVVDGAAGLGACDIVFVTVASDRDFADVVAGEHGIASGERVPSVVVDLTTVSAAASADVRERLASRGVALLAAPVSGNAKVIDAGMLSVVVSGPEEALEVARPYLEQLARSVTYVGEGELARLVKICHNLYLGIVIQGLIEVAVLGEKAGVKRSALLEFINSSVMGSVFSGYKTPALVNLDYTPTFTLELLLKDLTLALNAAKELGVPLPVGSTVQQIAVSGVGHGYGDVDFASLIELAARGAGLELVPENVTVPSPFDAAPPHANAAVPESGEPVAT